MTSYIYQQKDFTTYHGDIFMKKHKDDKFLQKAQKYLTCKMCLLQMKRRLSNNLLFKITCQVLL